MTDLSTKLDDLVEAIKKVDGQALANLGGSGAIAIEDLKREKKKLTRYAKEQILQAFKQSLPEEYPTEYVNISDSDGVSIGKLAKLAPEKQGYNQAIRDIKDRLEGK